MLATIPSATYELNAAAIPHLLTGALMALLAVVVMIRQRSVLSANLFALTSAAVATWLLSFGIMECAQRDDVALIWARAGFAAVALLPAILYHFTTALLVAAQHRFRGGRIVHRAPHSGRSTEILGTLSAGR